LPAGQLEGQPLHERGHQPVVATRCGRPGLRQPAVAALRQCPLQPDSLVERQPMAGLLALGLVIGQVDGAQRGVFGHQTTLAHNAFRKRIRDRIQHAEHLAHAGVDLPALQFGAGRIDREELPLEGRHRQLAAFGLREVGDGLERLAAERAPLR
jgi:hypothetical protein